MLKTISHTILTLFISLMANISMAQKPVDLFQGLNIQKAKQSGQWKLDDGQLESSGQKSLLMLPQQVTGSYSLTLEFTREQGNDSINIILPVGNRQCSLNMSTFDGEAHGIATIDNKLARSNDTTIKPGKLENNHTYRLQTDVTLQGDNVSINSQLDGKPFLKWTGKQASLGTVGLWNIPKGNNIGLMTFKNKTVFHKATLGQAGMMGRMTSATTTKTSKSNRSSEKTSEKTIDFENQKWIISNAASASVKNYKGKKALYISGQEKAFVYLQKQSLQDGTIEVDIASDTFSGIGFHGNQSGTIVEKLYFRPFNSGTAKHDKSVQYSMLGQPNAHWRALRETFPGKYESGANIKNNEWFHVRIVIKDERMEAFVNEDKTPVLVVEPLLQKSNDGRLGVWSWGGYFANFEITEAK